MFINKLKFLGLRLIVFIVSLYLALPSGVSIGGQEGFLNLPEPGKLLQMSAWVNPLVLRGMVINPLKPLNFNFIIDQGSSSSNQQNPSLKEETTRLVKYFLAALTIPESDLWVNLSPYEKNRIVPSVLGKTVLGQDLLAQDYTLKELTSSLMYPESKLGHDFWKQVYEHSQRQFGTTSIAVNTFNKVWILPDLAEVYQHKEAVYITKAHLKVMLDQDYVAMVKGSANAPVNSVGSQMVRQIILPQIEKEVNQGANFALLRQVYYALILAKWYKEAIKNSLLAKIYQDKNKIKGIDLADPHIKDKIYARYIQAYKKGVFNYIKEEADLNGQIIPRKYFSGGAVMVTHLSSTANPPVDTPAMMANVNLAMLTPIPQDAWPNRVPLKSFKRTDGTVVVAFGRELSGEDVYKPRRGSVFNDFPYFEEVPGVSFARLENGVPVGYFLAITRVEEADFERANIKAFTRGADGFVTEVRLEAGELAEVEKLKNLLKTEFTVLLRNKKAKVVDSQEHVLSMSDTANFNDFKDTVNEVKESGSFVLRLHGITSAKLYLTLMKYFSPNKRAQDLLKNKVRDILDQKSFSNIVLGDRYITINFKGSKNAPVILVASENLIGAYDDSRKIKKDLENLTVITDIDGIKAEFFLETEEQKNALEQAGVTSNIASFEGSEQRRKEEKQTHQDSLIAELRKRQEKVHQIIQENRVFERKEQREAALNTASRQKEVTQQKSVPVRKSRGFKDFLKSRWFLISAVVAAVGLMIAVPVVRNLPSYRNQRELNHLLHEEIEKEASYSYQNGVMPQDLFDPRYLSAYEAVFAQDPKDFLKSQGVSDSFIQSNLAGSFIQRLANRVSQIPGAMERAKEYLKDDSSPSQQLFGIWMIAAHMNLPGSNLTVNEKKERLENYTLALKIATRLYAYDEKHNLRPVIMPVSIILANVPIDEMQTPLFDDLVKELYKAFKRATGEDKDYLRFMVIQLFTNPSLKKIIDETPAPFIINKDNSSEYTTYRQIELLGQLLYKVHISAQEWSYVNDVYTYPASPGIKETAQNILARCHTDAKGLLWLNTRPKEELPFEDLQRISNYFNFTKDGDFSGQESDNLVDVVMINARSKVEERRKLAINIYAHLLRQKNLLAISLWQNTYNAGYQHPDFGWSEEAFKELKHLLANSPAGNDSDFMRMQGIAEQLESKKVVADHIIQAFLSLIKDKGNVSDEFRQIFLQFQYNFRSNFHLMPKDIELSLRSIATQVIHPVSINFTHILPNRPSLAELEAINSYLVALPQEARFYTPSYDELARVADVGRKSAKPGDENDKVAENILRRLAQGLNPEAIRLLGIQVKISSPLSVQETKRVSNPAMNGGIDLKNINLKNKSTDAPQYQFDSAQISAILKEDVLGLSPIITSFKKIPHLLSLFN